MPDFISFLFKRWLPCWIVSLWIWSEHHLILNAAQELDPPPLPRPRPGPPRPAPARPAPRRTFHVVYSTSGNMQSRNSVATLCDVTCEAPWHS